MKVPKIIKVKGEIERVLILKGLENIKIASKREKRSIRPRTLVTGVLTYSGDGKMKD
jgi:hypothetical protein